MFHHDEAIHAWFSWTLLTTGEYVYDPVYHGPFLYYITAGIFSLFGESDFVARFIPALLGALIIPLVYVIHRLGYLDKKQTIVAALFIALSPDMIYFSRFLRNDIFILFFTMLLLVALLCYFEKYELRYALLAGAAAGLGMSSKENMPIVIGIFGLYLLYLIYRGKIQLPKFWWRDLAAGIILATGIMALFYSSMGSHPEVLMSGWMNAIEHWTSVHGEERLGGPFYTYILLFILYELPVLILAAIGIYRFVLRRKNTNTVEGISDSGMLPDTDHLSGTNSGAVLPPAVPKLIKDLPGSLKNAEFTGFCIFWMVFSVVLYGYIGEKVPWLLLHQLLPMIFVAVYCIGDYKRYVPAVAALFLIVMTFHVVFTPADIAEPIVQVQNSEDLREVFAMVDASDNVAISNDVRWPFVWYYRNDWPDKISYFNGYQDHSDYVLNNNFDLIILHDAESPAGISGYDKSTYKKHYWFSVYDLVKTPWSGLNPGDAGYFGAVGNDLDNIGLYYCTRDAKVGSLNMDVYRKNIPAV
ncbi:flippase activity-associated protein Agl23 [Methanoplanus endosymbiosus]|uniref:TIGR03663 family protein n=1 Tax=Methanoplanus endosymbiosus TaxID=33865 RepID=A0A9E7PTB2_9EURY|nr:flippase activity-associated protein Agl23 [Methanoplanus endosymbiosus]UUX93502.1 TIGR03663 family protein [Methanoplanus endosymbiosus]